MNKKKLIYGLVIPLLAVFLVSAAILTYYALFSVIVEVNQPIRITYGGNTITGWNGIIETVNCDAGRECLGKVIRVYNDGDEDREVTISSTVDENIPVRYIGLLGLSTKDTTDWSITGNKANIKYIVVGDEFSAEVTGGAVEGYELIYYKDKENAFSVAERQANPQPAIRIADISGDLPYTTDGNSKLGANYTQNPDNYEHPRGAKLWYVDSDDILAENLLNWANWGNFLYETELIRYFDNSEGKIVVPAGDFVELYIEYSPNTHLSGDKTITTTIA